MKKVIVLSLGGSLIIPDNINSNYLRKFRAVLLRNMKNFKFVVVCGGGATARRYIDGLNKEELKEKNYLQGLLGISSTRLNARFMNYFFGRDSKGGIPHDMKEIKNLLRVHNVVFCGALRYAKRETSDSTSAKLANYFDTAFINLTNVSGLYTKDPRKFKDAKFIKKITWKDFHKKAEKLKFKPGQHFVLDQTGSEVIFKNKIPTYIIGKDVTQLENFLKGKSFVGTTIRD